MPETVYIEKDPVTLKTDAGSKVVLVFTHSDKENMKEACRFTVDSSHNVRFAKGIKKR